jgi:hypothetical protein
MARLIAWYSRGSACFDFAERGFLGRMEGEGKGRRVQGVQGVHIVDEANDWNGWIFLTAFLNRDSWGRNVQSYALLQVATQRDSRMVRGEILSVFLTLKD